MRPVIPLTFVVAALALAGCGGSSSSGAASCLKYALASGSGPGSCQQTKGGQTAESIFSNGFGGASAKAASCVNKTGNEYSCTVTMTDGTTAGYSVTYDGKSIDYQQTQ